MGASASSFSKSFDAREAERRALINALADDIDPNPNYGGTPTPTGPATPRSTSGTTSGYASTSRAMDASAPAGTSWYVSVFLVVNAALGAGLLCFPHAFHEAGGIEIALTVQTLMLLIAASTLIILAHCADANESPTYQDVVKSCLGPKFHILCSSLIALYCYGSCITFLIIIGDQWDRFFWSYNANFCHVFYTNRPFTVSVTSILFILPLCYPRRIDFLKYVSTAGVAAIVYVVVIAVWKYYDGGYVPGEIKHAPDQWTDVFFVTPTIFFGYQCHVSSVPIYHCLKGRSTRSFVKTALTSLLVCMLAYSLVAVYGYLTFGGDVTDDILVNYDPNDPSVLASMIAIAAKTYTTYPLLLFCGRAGIESLWVKFHGLGAEQAEAGELIRRIIIATIWFLTSVVAAIFIPGINVVISFLGAFAGLFIVVFPGLCLIKVTLDKRSDPQASRLTENSPLLNESASPETTAPILRISKPRSSVVDWMLIGYGAFLVVFGMFVFGVILVNSFQNKISNVPLCV